MESNFSDAGFVRFDSKIYDAIDSKGEKYFGFDKNQFEIRSIRFDSTSSSEPELKWTSMQQVSFFMYAFQNEVLQKQ